MVFVPLLILVILHKFTKQMYWYFTICFSFDLGNAKVAKVEMVGGENITLCKQKSSFRKPIKLTDL